MSTKAELLDVIYDMTFGLSCEDILALAVKTLDENNFKNEHYPPMVWANMSCFTANTCSCGECKRGS